MALHVAFVNPEIHWNTGNAGRSCLAAGATLHLIEPLGFSLAEREVRRAGLDYWEHVDVRVSPSWAAFEQALPSLGEPYFFSTQGTRFFWDAPFAATRDLARLRQRDSRSAAGDSRSLRRSHAGDADHFAARPLAEPFDRGRHRAVRGASAMARVKAAARFLLPYDAGR